MAGLSANRVEAGPPRGSICRIARAQRSPDAFGPAARRRNVLWTNIGQSFGAQDVFCRPTRRIRCRCSVRDPGTAENLGVRRAVSTVENADDADFPDSVSEKDPQCEPAKHGDLSAKWRKFSSTFRDAGTARRVSCCSRTIYRRWSNSRMHRLRLSEDVSARCFKQKRVERGLKPATTLGTSMVQKRRMVPNSPH